MDKYGVGQDTYCYPQSSVLRNRLGITDSTRLSEAERDLSTLAANEIDFQPPPYDIAYWQPMHHHLFKDLYDWAGQLRTVDIAKGSTRFCTTSRIEAEAEKLFAQAAHQNWFTHLPRFAFIEAIAELFGELNMIHPFREGNGRAQRILFDHVVVNAGYTVEWSTVLPDEWKAANISAVHCDYAPLGVIFARCLAGRISPD